MKSSEVYQKDAEILRFLWRWKVATTTMIAFRFFPQRALMTGYWRLNRLRKLGFIAKKLLERDNRQVWTLTNKGFSSIKNSLGELKEDGYKSETLWHDLVTSAFQIGDWIEGLPSGVILCSEQEMRRYNLENLSKWMPEESQRRPDGYWFLAGKDSFVKTIALEIETSNKSNDTLASVMESYSVCEDIDEVVWLTSTKNQARKPKEICEKFAIEGEEKHQSLLIEEFKKLGWGAKFLFGTHSGKTVSDYLQELLANKDTESKIKNRSKTGQRSVKSFLSRNLLDSRIVPIKTKFYGTPSDAENR